MPINPIKALEEASKVDGDVRVEYTSQAEFEHLAALFGVFREWKVGLLVHSLLFSVLYML